MGPVTDDLRETDVEDGGGMAPVEDGDPSVEEEGRESASKDIALSSTLMASVWAPPSNVELGGPCHLSAYMLVPLVARSMTALNWLRSSEL
jgi:hypothetical protein